MRNHRDFIKEMDFVAEYDGKIIGNIMHTKAWLINEKGYHYTQDIFSIAFLSYVKG